MEQYTRDGLTFDVAVEGPDDGAPVVLLHGFPQNHHAWDAVVPLLHAGGCRTFAPDQRGYSPGARPTARRAYSGAELTADVIALLDTHGIERAHVVGHDWGGAVVWGLGADYPDRIASVTAVSTSHPAAFTGSMLRSTQALHSWYMLFFQLPWLPERVVGDRRLKGALRKSGLPKEYAEHYAALMQQPGAPRGGINWYRGLPFSLKTPVGRCKVPTTYVWGNRDAFLGRKGADMTAAYVAADYRFVELDGHHWLPETHAEDVAAAVLDRVATVAAEPSTSA